MSGKVDEVFFAFEKASNAMHFFAVDILWMTAANAGAEFRELAHDVPVLVSNERRAFEGALAFPIVAMTLHAVVFVEDAALDRIASQSVYGRERGEFCDVGGDFLHSTLIEP